MSGGGKPYSADNPFAPQATATAPDTTATTDAYSADNPFAPKAAPPMLAKPAAMSGPPETPESAAIREHYAKFKQNPAAIARGEHGEMVTVGRPQPTGRVPTETVARASAGEFGLPKAVEGRLSISRGPTKESADEAFGGPSGSAEREAMRRTNRLIPPPDLSDVALHTFLNHIAGPFTAGVSEVADEDVMRRAYEGGENLSEPALVPGIGGRPHVVDWKADLLGTLATTGSAIGNLLFGKALGGIEAPSATGVETVASRLGPESVNAARQAGATAGQRVVEEGGEGVTTRHVLKQVVDPANTASDAVRRGAIKAIEDVAAKHEVHPSRVAALVAKSTEAFAARAPQLKEAGKLALAQGAQGAAVTGAEDLAAGERDPAQLARTMGIAALQFGLLGGALHAAGGEAQFQAGYKTMRNALESSPEVFEALTRERAARAAGATRDDLTPSGEPADAGSGGGAVARYSPDNPFAKPEGTTKGTTVEMGDRAAAVQRERELLDKRTGQNLAKPAAPPAPRGETPVHDDEPVQSAFPRVYPARAGRTEPFTPEEQRTRELTEKLKQGRPKAIDLAAREMAPRVPKGAVLVPVPDHTGSTEHTRSLANAIAALHQGVSVGDVLTRSGPTESSLERRRAGGKGLTAEEQAASIIAKKRLTGKLGDRPVALVDNVETTGATMHGARAALGRPDALTLTFAKAPIPEGEEAVTHEQSRALIAEQARKAENRYKEHGDVGELLMELSREHQRLEKEREASGGMWVAKPDMPVAEGGRGSLPSGSTFAAGRAKQQAGYTTARLTEIEERLKDLGVHADDIDAARQDPDLAIEMAAKFSPEPTDADVSFDQPDDIVDLLSGGKRGAPAKAAGPDGGRSEEVARGGAAERPGEPAAAPRRQLEPPPSNNAPRETGAPRAAAEQSGEPAPKQLKRPKQSKPVTADDIADRYRLADYEREQLHTDAGHGWPLPRPEAIDERPEHAVISHEETTRDVVHHLAAVDAIEDGLRRDVDPDTDKPFKKPERRAEVEADLRRQKQAVEDIVAQYHDVFGEAGAQLLRNRSQEAFEAAKKGDDELPYIDYYPSERASGGEATKPEPATHKQLVKPGPALEVAPNEGTPDLIVIPCGSDKVGGTDKVRADQLYTGQYFKSALAYARAIAPDANIRILSAKHGLLRLHDEVAPYDVKMGDPKAISAIELTGEFRSAGFTKGGGKDVRVIGGKEYVNLVAQAFPGARRVMPAGLGIGEQLAELKRLTAERGSQADESRQPARTAGLMDARAGENRNPYRQDSPLYQEYEAGYSSLPEAERGAANVLRKTGEQGDIDAAAADRATSPMSAQRLVEHAGTKGYGTSPEAIDRSAAVLRGAGYGVTDDMVREAKDIAAQRPPTLKKPAPTPSAPASGDFNGKTIEEWDAYAHDVLERERDDAKREKLQARLAKSGVYDRYLAMDPDALFRLWERESAVAQSIGTAAAKKIQAAHPDEWILQYKYHALVREAPEWFRASYDAGWNLSRYLHAKRARGSLGGAEYVERVKSEWETARDKAIRLIEAARGTTRAPEASSAAPEKTELFGNAVEPETKQDSMFGEHEGTEVARSDAKKLKRHTEKISADEMTERRDELGAPKQLERPKDTAEKGEAIARGEQPKAVIQSTLDEGATPATSKEMRKLVEVAADVLRVGALKNSGPKDLRALAERALGRPYESRTWTMDDVYDAIEGAANQIAQDDLGLVVTGQPIPETTAEGLEKAKSIEETFFGSRARTEAMASRGQFSTPLPIARAAQIAAGVRAGDKVLEPTAGTGNLVLFLDSPGVTIDVNEIDPRRVAVLEALGFKPTSEDALRLPLNGKRYNVVVMNPPFGSAGAGKYAGFGATPFTSNDISQRFVAAALSQLVDGGRLVAILPDNVLGAESTAFRSWLAEHHTPDAYVASWPDAYKTRGTDVQTVMLVVNKGQSKAVARKAPPKTFEPETFGEWVKIIQLFDAGWLQHTGNLADEQMDLSRAGGFGKAEDVAPLRQLDKPTITEKPQAELFDRAATGATLQTEGGHGTGTESERPAGRNVAPGFLQKPGESRSVAPVGGVRSLKRPSESGSGSEPGAGRDTPVVAEAGSGEPATADAGRAADVVSGVPRGRVESRARDSAEREREIAAANDSPVFTPYALGDFERRNPHPRLVVETRAMAGMPAPPITAKFNSPLVEAAWGRSFDQGGISDEQADGALRILSAWENGHGFALSDDVGVGKTREAAAVILDAIKQGHSRILFTTKNENNVVDAMAEFRKVASGSEDGAFPAKFIFVGDYKDVKKGTASLPTPDGPTIYFAHAYNLAAYHAALAEVKPTVWVADEAHEYKNQFSARGIAWRGLHDQMLKAGNANFAYLTATPGVTLDDLGYMYGLREWKIGGFADWVARKLGKKNWDEKEGGDSERAAEDAGADIKEMGDRSEDVSNLQELKDDDKKIAHGNRKFMAGKDVFENKVTPAETEQVMRELKGAGKYVSRDLWRGGVKFDVQTVDLVGNSPEAKRARATYDQAAELSRDISMAARKFGRMNKKVKTAGLDRALIQSYLKQLLFGLRLPTLFREADASLKAGQQVVISVHSVTGDTDIEEGLSESDAETPVNERLRSAINRINVREIEKVGDGAEASYNDLGEIPEALIARAELLDRLAALEPLPDPVRAVEEHFGAKNVAVITGKRSAKQRKAAMGDFQRGARTVALISKAGKVGISLHDVNGKQRRMLVGDYEWSADTFKQELGRVDRTGQRSAPHVSLVASNLAGETKFAATIAARMASLGATSKGSAESTGTDALDQFDVSDSISLGAMRQAVFGLSDELRTYFTGSKFLEWMKTGRGKEELIPKKAPDKAGMRDFLLDLMMFPVKSAQDVWAQWVQAREELRTGESAEKQAARRTGRSKGTVLRRTVLTNPKDPKLTMVEMKNEAGEKIAILQGFVTPYINEIQEARGLSETGLKKSRRYVHVTTPDGELVTGLELQPGESWRVKDVFGKGARKTMTPDEAWTDLRAGDHITVSGAGDERWVLHQRKDGRIQISGATVSKHRTVLQGLANYESVGNYLFVPGDEAAVAKFLERFPPKVAPPKKAKTPPTEEGGGMKLYGVGDPVTALALMLHEALKGPPTGGYPEPSGMSGNRNALRPHELVTALQKLLNPESLGPEAVKMAGTARHQRAVGFRELAIAKEATLRFKKAIDKLPRAVQVEYWGNAEHGESTGNAFMDAGNAQLHKITEEVTDQLIAFDRLKAEATIDNYIGRYWTLEKGAGEQARDFLRTIMGRRPFEGPKTFLKKRRLENFADGFAIKGLRPATYNWVEAQLGKLAEMQRVLAAERILAIEKEAGRAKPVMLGKEVPRADDGREFLRIEPTGKDPAFNIYGPRGGMVKLPSDAKEAGVDPNEVEVIGPRVIGQWYAHPDAAAVWDNMLSRGFAGNPVYDALMAPAQAAVQVLLGFSGFHATVIATEGIFSDLALAVDNLANAKGNAADGLKQVAGAPLAFVQTARLGHRVMKEYRAPGMHPELARVLDAMIAGGYRGRAESEFWTGERKEKLKRAVREAFGREQSHWTRTKGFAKLPFNTIYAAIELSMMPLMGKYVPYMKTGAMYKAAAQALSKLPKDASIEDIERVMGDVGKEMDYRFGQVDYDNHFINNFAKNLAQLIFLAPGWTFGTLALAGRGVHDVARLTRGAARGAARALNAERRNPWEKFDSKRPPIDVPKELVGRSAAYWIGAVLATAFINGLLTYYLTGEQPDGMDWWAFRDGTKDRDGNNNRHVIPGYLMKDVYGWSHHPVETFRNKLQPVWAFMARLAANKDYFGDLMYDPEGSKSEKAKEIGKAATKELRPLSVQNYLESKRRGEAGAGAVARNVFGVTPARRELIRTPAQNKLAEYLARRGHTALTPEQKDALNDRREISQGVREGTVPRDSVRRLIRAGELTPGQGVRAVVGAHEDPLLTKFKQLSAEEAEHVYALGNPAEQALWFKYMRAKRRGEQRLHRPAANQ